MTRRGQVVWRDQGPRLAPRDAWGTTHRLTAAQAASVIGVKRNTVYLWAKRGVLSRAADRFGRLGVCARYSHAECVAVRKEYETELTIRGRVADRRGMARNAANLALQRRHPQEFRELYVEAVEAVRAQVEAEMGVGPSADSDGPYAPTSTVPVRGQRQ